MKELVDRLQRDGHLRKEEYARLLRDFDDGLLEYAMACAREVTKSVFGTGIYIRGLIELTNFCRNDCYYCGIRKSNLNVERYRLSKEQVLECCAEGYGLGFRTFVLQGGEDAGMSGAFVEDLVRAIRAGYPDCAITLSLGEYDREIYQHLYDAGADRYLLRHETADRKHYGKLHPARMSFDKRMEALWTLREIGFQTGTGIMVGSPGQTVDTLVEDILFMEKFRPQMIGLGPYLPQCDTPFRDEPAGSLEVTLLLLSIFRLMFPYALIPSTTSLATLVTDGREHGILAGANVVMPNLSPAEFRANYALYDNKRAFGSEAAEGLKILEQQLGAIGYHISYDKGDYSDLINLGI